jgi:hypothetical protein
MKPHAASEGLAADLGAGSPGGGEEVQRQAEDVVSNAVSVAMSERDLVALILE